METNIVATINGVGVVEAANDLATFALTVRTKAENLDASKSGIQEKLKEVVGQLNSLKMNLHKEISTDIMNYKLEHREGTERYSAGFQSEATITFTVVIDENLDEINKTCLKIDKNMFFPFFDIKDRETLLQQAIKIATDNAKTKLNKECELLGVSTDTLRIFNWSYGYDGFLPIKNTSNMIYNNAYGITGPTGPQGSVGPTGPSGRISAAQKLGSIYQEALDYIPLDPGTIVVRVPVEINYVWA
jgi:uncharacterized protein DUF541